MIFFERHTKYKSIQFLEYVTVSGNAYIETGVMPTNATNINIDVSPAKSLNLTTGTVCLFGSRPGQAETPSYTLWLTGGKFRWDMNDSTTAMDFPKDYGTTRERLRFKKEDNQLIMDNSKGEPVDTKDVNMDPFSCSNTLWLLMVHQNKSDGRGFQGNFYGATVTHNGIVHNFKPALDEDGIVCVYDEYNKLFLKTGSFVAGPKL